MKYLSYFLFGFGLLFIGLSFMKTAMERRYSILIFQNMPQMPKIVFLLIGFIITLVVQSSSVTMALTLSALHAGVIRFPNSCCHCTRLRNGYDCQNSIGCDRRQCFQKTGGPWQCSFQYFHHDIGFHLFKSYSIIDH